MGCEHGRDDGVVGGASRPRRGDGGPHRAPTAGVWSVAQRVGWVAVILGAGCVFTPRPMIPFADDAGALTGVVSDVGRGAEQDAPAITPSTDAGAGWSSDAPGADAPSTPADSRCHRVGDGGFVDDAGQPCDPEESRDGGAADAACDAGADGATDGAACDGGAAAGVARGLR